MNDEFYVGYLDSCPPALAGFLRRVTAALAALVAVLVLLVAGAQDPTEPGSFEFGVRTTFEGILFEHPLPMLRRLEVDGTVRHDLLVGFGKYGMPAFARGHHGHRVRFDGSVIRSPRGRMIEMNAPDSFRVLDDSAPSLPDPPSGSVGEVVLTGELVDTKCYFGVMRPATGKVHRACAVRCLAGGVPPGLLVRDGAGGATVVLLLSGDDGRSPSLDPEWAARRLSVRGELEMRHGWAVLALRHVRRLD